jgi:hypothetical protein
VDLAEELAEITAEVLVLQVKVMPAGAVDIGIRAAQRLEAVVAVRAALVALGKPKQAIAEVVALVERLLLPARQLLTQAGVVGGRAGAGDRVEVVQEMAQQEQ